MALNQFPGENYLAFHLIEVQPAGKRRAPLAIFDGHWMCLLYVYFNEYIYLCI